MRRLHRIVQLLCAFTAACPLFAADQQPVLTWHFVGTRATLNSNPESVWAQVAKIKPADAFYGQIKSRLSEWIPARLGWKDNGWAGTTTFTRSMLDQLAQRESILHVAGEDLDNAAWVLAVHASGDDRDRFTRTLLNGGRQFKFAEPRSIKVDGIDGWVISTGDGGKRFSYVAAEDWVVVSDDVEKNAMARSLIASIVARGRPDSLAEGTFLTLSVAPEILDLKLNLPVVGAVSRISAEFSWQGDSVRTMAEVEPVEALNVELDSWRTPKKIVSDPLVSFTAVRGAKPWLGRFAAVRALPDDLRPNQIFNWSRGDISVLSDLAFPVADASQAYELLKKSVLDSYGDMIRERSLGTWLSATNVNRFTWRGLPLFVPYFEPVTSDEQDFIKGGVFPLVKEANERKSVPEELFRQFEGREDLFYYDWEISAARLAAFQQAESFVTIVFPPKPKLDGAHGVDWMNEIAARLKNAVTEGTITDEGHVQLVRRSAIGLSGIELWMLTHWLDSTEFPAFPYTAPPRRGSGPGGQATREKPLPRARPVNR